MNFKVKCISDRGKCHTIGKIYNVINGFLDSDNNKTNYPCLKNFGYSSVEDINNDLMSQFELYVEKTLKEQLLEWSKMKIIVVECSNEKQYFLMTNGRLIPQTKAKSSVHINMFDDKLLKISNYTANIPDSIDIIYQVDIYAVDDFSEGNQLQVLLWKRKQKQIELTLDEIAKKFNIDVNNLKIKKVK